MNIALVGKWDGQDWRAENCVQRGFWALGHEVQTVPMNDEGLIQIQDSIDLTVVMQGYGLSPEAIVSVQRRIGNPVILWHGEIMSPTWPTTDPVVQAKAAQLVQNIGAYDLVLHNCYTCLDTLLALGAKKVGWCPTNGTDTLFHERLDVQKRVDIGIYGWPSKRRIGIVEEVLNHLNGVTAAWPNAGTGQVYGAALSSYINQCKCILNIHFSETQNTECRAYETLGCGSILISEPMSMNLFPEGTGTFYGKSPEELAAQIQTVLSWDTEKYSQCADAGYQFVHDNYRYEQRCQQLLEVIDKELSL